MPLTPKEAFKAGFLARCEEEGLESEDITLRIKNAHVLHYKVGNLTPEEEQFVKQAGPGGVLGGAAALGSGLLSFLLKSPWLMAGMGGLGGMAIGATGATVRNAADPSLGMGGPPEEILDIQAAELVQSLNRESSAARRRAAMIKRKREREEQDANRWSRI